MPAISKAQFVARRRKPGTRRILSTVPLWHGPWYVIVLTDDSGKPRCLPATYQTLREAWEEAKGWRDNFDYKATVKSITALAFSN